MPRKVVSGRDFVAINTIAGYCMVSSSTVRNWIKTGELKAVTLPSGQSRVPLAEFVEFLSRYGMPLPEQTKPAA